MLENLSATADFGKPGQKSHFRLTVYRILETADDNDLASRVVDLFLVVLICASVLAVILESIPSIEDTYGPMLYWFEVSTIAIFSIEYLLRVWSCVEQVPDGPANPALFRMRFILSFHSIVDILAILPFYLLAFGLFGGIDMRFLRAVRLLRVLKLTRYFSALNLLINTVKENSQSLAAAFLILLTTMLLASSGIYYFEREAQPVDFGSIPAAMWWAFVTLTTVGYGDVTPVTVGGKIFGALVTVVGVGMVALPAGILASGFNQQFERNEKQFREKAEEALDDGVLSDTEIRELESLRVNLGMGRHTASQILDERTVRAALEELQSQACCPHCKRAL